MDYFHKDCFVLESWLVSLLKGLVAWDVLLKIAKSEKLPYCNVEIYWEILDGVIKVRDGLDTL